MFVVFILFNFVDSLKNLVFRKVYSFIFFCNYIKFYKNIILQNKMLQIFKNNKLKKITNNEIYLILCKFQPSEKWYHNEELVFSCHSKRMKMLVRDYYRVFKIYTNLNKIQEQFGNFGWFNYTVKPNII
jgi:hypothetical protein